MNIKIKHFQKKKSYPNNGKTKLLAALGLAASLGIAGCDITGEPLAGAPAMPESSSSEEPPLGGEIIMPESSSSTEVPESSSSIKTPIPIGGVPVDPIQPLAGTIMVIDEESSSSISSSSSTEVIESSSSIDIPVVGIPAMPEPELVPEEFDPDKIIPIVIEEP
jgi:hypothetical protein